MEGVAEQGRAPSVQVAPRQGSGRLLPRLIGLAGCTLAVLLAVRFWHRSIVDHLFFDDAMIFLRYALHMRQSHVVAWNPGGPPVFGATSMPWLLIMWAGSFFIADPSRLVVSLSCATGLLALLLLALAIVRGSGSVPLSKMIYVLPMVSLPLLLDVHFSVSFTNGMETMLGLLANVLFAAGVLRFARVPDARSASLLAFAGAFSVLTRPEMLLCVGLMPLLAWYLLVPAPRPSRPLLLYCGLLTALLGADLVFNVLYFGSALPLSFYLKSVHGYDGYAVYSNPFAYTTFFFGMCLFPLLAVACFVRRRDARMLAVFALPVALTVLYLLSVLQVMGVAARYYVPLLPFVLLPAARMMDDALIHGRLLQLAPARFAAVVITLLVSVNQFSNHLAGPIGTILAKRRSAYAFPAFDKLAKVDLPSNPNDWWSRCYPVATIAKSLPPGANMATTEVGLIGVFAPEVNIHDLAGLNDNKIAHQGFSLDDVFARNPELIWLPYPDYSRLYGALASDPRLLERYVVYAGAYQLGLAVRKDLPPDSSVVLAVKRVWAETYPGVDMNAYVVRHVSWEPVPVPHSVRSVTVYAP